MDRIYRFHFGSGISLSPNREVRIGSPVSDVATQLNFRFNPAFVGLDPVRRCQSDPIIFTASSTMDRIYRFLLMSSMRLSTNRDVGIGTSGSDLTAQFHFRFNLTLVEPF